MTTALSVFDPILVAEGANPEQALSESVQLARTVDRLGYKRLWHGEHHLNPGVLGYSPALTLALTAGVTTSIRLGAGAALAGPRTALSVAEDFALLEAAHPGRIDLGVGRAAVRQQQFSAAQTGAQHRDGAGPASRKHAAPAQGAVAEQPPPSITPEGAIIPAAPDLGSLLGSPRQKVSSQLLMPDGAVAPDYGEFLDQLLGLLQGHLQLDGVDFSDGVAATRHSPQVWVLGSSAGASAEAAGARGLRFGGNYHVAPAATIDAVTHYRRHFRPSTVLSDPEVIVSAEVLVSDTEQEARRLASGYEEWVYSIRSGRGAIPYPRPDKPLKTSTTPGSATRSARQLSARQKALVSDRTATRFIGTADQVAEQLDSLKRATGADELLISVSAHNIDTRCRSYELLAELWDDMLPPTPLGA